MPKTSAKLANVLVGFMLLVRIGTALVAYLAPETLMACFGAPPDKNPHMPYIVRVFGIRDLVLGGLVIALYESHLHVMLYACMIIDSFDVLSALLSSRNGSYDSEATVGLVMVALAALVPEGLALGLLQILKVTTCSGKNIQNFATKWLYLLINSQLYCIRGINFKEFESLHHLDKIPRAAYLLRGGLPVPTLCTCREEAGGARSCRRCRVVRGGEGRGEQNVLGRLIMLSQARHGPGHVHVQQWQCNAGRLSCACTLLCTRHPPGARRPPFSHPALGGRACTGGGWRPSLVPAGPDRARALPFSHPRSLSGGGGACARRERSLPCPPARTGRAPFSWPQCRTHRPHKALSHQMSKPSQRNATVSSPTANSSKKQKTAPADAEPFELVRRGKNALNPEWCAQRDECLLFYEDHCSEEELTLLVEQVNKAKQPAELSAVCQKLLRGLVGARAIAETFQCFADRSDCDRCQLYACESLACSEWRHPEETSGCPCGHTANSD
eukprot:g63442.t1